MSRKMTPAARPRLHLPRTKNGRRFPRQWFALLLMVGLLAALIAAESIRKVSAHPAVGHAPRTSLLRKRVFTPRALPAVATNVIINEVDSDTPGADDSEFIELYDGGVGNTSLNGLVVVLYDGSGNALYNIFDLNGRSTDASGYFVIGTAVVPGVDLVLGFGFLQNGPDAVALYAASVADFNGSITTTNLLDAVVYDTSDDDDPQLLVLLNPGQPQVNEDAGGNGPNNSIGRCANGAGGERNTSTYVASLPSPGLANNCPVDTDADGVPDATDNCPLNANADQANNDGDSMGDVCDPDDDNDGQADDEEIACGSNPMDANSQGIDTDFDHHPDCVDLDDDGDGVVDINDNCPLTPNADQADDDGDGVGNACDSNPNDGPTGDADGDGRVNNADNCPNVANSDQADFDADGLGDACDPDDDNDNIADANDLCPNTPAGTQVNAAGCPDADGDEVADATDNCPNKINADQADFDQDGLGNACDADDDNDGVPDETDNCSLTANPNQSDNDSDGVGDACDSDDDNDGQPDTADNCPLVANADQADNDHDGIGNVCDPDDDNDGVPDVSDNCSFMANPNQADNDHDGSGDACDPDDDNDGVPDGNDNCPFTANPNQADVDGDGVGDACETDSDGDGVQDATDNCPSTFNPNQLDTNHDGVGDACTGFQFPAGGAFVIGDKVDLSGGATVYFWGSQWSQNNPMSGGGAPSSFKGFEGNNSSPACGGSWTIGSGNSSAPPATLPQYMAVIVSSSIQKNGNTVSGDISKIVIVRTNPGYGPSPSQYGTGTVVAVICVSGPSARFNLDSVFSGYNREFLPMVIRL